MNDDTAPAWASALLVTLDRFRAEARERFDLSEAQIERWVDRSIGAETTGLERDLVRSRTKAKLAQAADAMQRQIAQLKSQVHELHRKAEQ